MSVVFLGCFFLLPPLQGSSEKTLGVKTAEARRRQRTPPVHRRDRGMMLNMDLGINGCTDRLCHDILPMLNLRFSAVFRFERYFGAGMHMGFLFGHPKDNRRRYLVDFDERATFDSFWLLVIAPEFRLFLPHGNWDFWGALVPGFARWMGEAYYGPRDWFDASMNGFVMGWGFGADYYVHPMIALGATAYFYHPHFDELCLKEGRVKACYDMSKWDRHDIGMWWSVGFRFTLFFGF